MNRVSPGLITSMLPHHEALRGLFPGADERDQQLAEFLLQNKVYVSTRYTAHIGGTRVSVHFFNNRDDIASLFAALDAFQP